MRLLRRLGAAFLLAALALSLAVTAGAETAPQRLTVLFTHDTHDHFYPDAADVGGYTRLATAIRTERAAADCPTVTLDAGDFSMGSLFQTIYTTDAPELRALGAMGYDVTTLGNHEFDYRQRGLAEMLTAAQASGDALPAIVQANYRVPEDPDSPDAQALTKVLDSYPVTDYTVLEREGLRVAVFGVMGVDSDECAPMSGMSYEPMIDAARRVVADIRAKEAPDFILCLSHGGTEGGRGEDYELARQVDGIDLIVSGHTHTTLAAPIQVNGTAIVSCGPYAQDLGVVTLVKGGGCSDYRLVGLDASVAADPAMTALAQRFKGRVDEGFLNDYELEYDSVLSRSDVDFTIAQTGDLIGRAYIAGVEKLEGDGYIPVDFAVAPAGVVRDALRRGEIATAQAFDILSLGSGADGSAGYPLVSVYLTGRDLKNVFEVDASISALMEAATIYGAGASWRYHPRRMFLDRVTGCSLADGSPIEDDRLYRVVADLYSGQMLSAVKGKSMGLLSITPRDERGAEVTDFESRILRDGQGRELKAWYVLADYLKSQDTVAPPPPSKTVQTTWSPLVLLWPMGLPTALVCALVLLIALAAALTIRHLIRRRRDRRAYRPYRGKR